MDVTYDISDAKLFAFEVNKFDDDNTGEINITWHIPVPGGYVEYRAVSIPSDDLEPFNLLLQDVYGLLYDETQALGATVTDTEDLRELGP